MHGEAEVEHVPRFKFHEKEPQFGALSFYDLFSAQVLGYASDMLRGDELHASVENLYTVFGGYKLRDDTNACPCCHKPEDERALHSKPLRELTAGDLKLYAEDALLVWGGVDDFRHFLPRIFELVTVLDDPTTELVLPQILYARLSHGEWWNWPQEEQIAVRSHLHALWNSVLRSDPEEPVYADIEDWLCGIAQAENDLAEYFRLWLEEGSREAALNLACLVTEHSFIQEVRATEGFWSKRKEQYEQVRQWLLSSDVRAKLEAVYATIHDERLELPIAVLK